MSDLPPVSERKRPPNLRVKPPKKSAKAVKEPVPVRRLKKLHCFDEVHRMVVGNWSLSDIARFIQKTKGELTECTEGTVIAYLAVYRKWLPPTVLLEKRLPEVFHQAARKVAEGLDVIAEMERLYEIQMKRIQIDFAHEQELKKLMPTMTAEIRCGREILEALAKTKVEFGLEAGQMVAGAELPAYQGKDAVKRVLESAPSRQKLLSLATRFLSVVEVRTQEIGEQAGGDLNGDTD